MKQNKPAAATKGFKKLEDSNSKTVITNTNSNEDDSRSVG